MSPSGYLQLYILILPACVLISNQGNGCNLVLVTVWRPVCGFYERWMCVWIHSAFVRMFKTGGCSHTHSQERKCQCSTSCLSGSVSAAVARHRAGHRQRWGVWFSRKPNNDLFSLVLDLPLSSLYTLHTNTVVPFTPFHTFLLCKGTPATYRTESIPLHTGWVPHWPLGLMKKTLKFSPITYRKGIYLTLLRPLVVFTTLPPSSVALLLRSGWLLWSGPAL